MPPARARWVAVVSRTAATLRVAWEHDPLVRAQLAGVVSDRACSAEEWARSRGIAVTRIEEADGERFSDALLEHMTREGATHGVLFFTRLLSGELLERYQNRLVNLHPSLLPAFKGLYGYRDARAAAVRFVGTTIHFIDPAMDEGRPILQSAFPFDWSAPEELARERQFEQLCRGLVQVCHWLEEDRIEPAGRGTRIADARYDDPEFSPALEAACARNFRVSTTAIG